MPTSPDHDQDSMMALEALLKIKSNNFEACENSSPLKPPQLPPTAFGNNSAVINLDRHFIPMTVLSTNSSSCFGPHLTRSPGITSDVYASKTQGMNCHNSMVETRESTPSLKMEAEDVMDVVLRQEQIGAALRSKPQRGRKRDNLSVRERLELTRTRNREHAKSTRIRKKARYHELIEKENLHDELKAQMDLNDARIEAVRSFITCRSNLLKADLSPSERLLCRHSLHQALHDPTTFAFEGHGPQHDDAMIRMDMLEHETRRQVVARFGEDAGRQLEYRLVGGADAIGITKSGVVMVEVSLMTKDSCHEDATDLLIMEALIRWTFASQSDKLTKVLWSTISNIMGKPENENATMDPTDSAKDLLGMQLCHPSVVSLDQGTTSLEHHPHQYHSSTPPHSPQDGPGMNL